MCLFLAPIQWHRTVFFRLHVAQCTLWLCLSLSQYLPWGASAHFTDCERRTQRHLVICIHLVLTQGRHVFLDCCKEQRQNRNSQVRAKKIKGKHAGISEAWALGGGGQAGYMDYLASSKGGQFEIGFESLTRGSKEPIWLLMDFLRSRRVWLWGIRDRPSLRGDCEHRSISIAAPHGQMGTILRRETSPGRGPHRPAPPAVLPATSKHARPALGASTVHSPGVLRGDWKKITLFLKIRVKYT